MVAIVAIVAKLGHGSNSSWSSVQPPSAVCN